MTVRLVPAIAVLLALLLAPSAQAAGPAATRSALERQMRSAGAASGALAIDVETDEVLVDARSDAARVPASVEKLYTSSTALALLGADGHFDTRALVGAPPDEEGVVAGELWLRGGGDPTFTTAELRRLAALVVAAGVWRVEGGVAGDESAFDSLRGPPSSGFRTSQYVGPLSALAYNRGRVGRWFQSRPALTAARAFQDALKQRGVRFGRRAHTGTAPADALTIAQWSSPPLSELVRRMNVPSDNYFAETLIKALGAEHGSAGSTTAGAAVVRSTLAGFGLSPRVVDGSGLARGNRTTPRQVVRLLDSATAQPWGEAFRDSLATAGRTGTLWNRMRGTAAQGRCRAKTGTLVAVSALAGYCETTAGRTVAFAFMMNRTNVYAARRIQDRMTAVLARYGA